MALGVLFNLYYLHTNRLTNPQALASATQACVAFYRSVLKHKIKLLKNWWVRALLPMLPGVLVVFYRFEQIFPAPHPNAKISPAQAMFALHAAEVFLVMFFSGFALVQQVRVRRLKRELQSLTFRTENQ
jgi:hypothetical protein